MKKVLITIGIVLLLLGIAGGVWYYFFRDVSQKNGELIHEAGNGDDIIVREDFSENFRDGEIDPFWLFDNGGLSENLYEIDFVREELTLEAAGRTSQWSTDDSAPLIYFPTDRNFSVDVEMNFDPRADFEHAGIGIRDRASGDWVRLSRAFDTHALEDELDIANSVYVMEKKGNEVLKYAHANFVDTKAYLRIEREGQKMVFSYSRNGRDWIKIDEREREDFGQEVDVYLFVYSTNPNPIKTVFRQINFLQLDQ